MRQLQMRPSLWFALLPVWILVAHNARSEESPKDIVGTNVYSVSSGPKVGVVRHRLVVVLSETDLHLYAEELRADDPEGLDIRVARQYEIPDSSVAGSAGRITQISSIQWMDPSRVRFKINQERDCELALAVDTYKVKCDRADH